MQMHSFDLLKKIFFYFYLFIYLVSPHKDRFPFDFHSSHNVSGSFTLASSSQACLLRIIKIL